MIIQGLAINGLTVSSSAATISPDTYFNLVTLLLPGTGTNGAQNNTFLDSSTNNFTVTRNGNTTQGTFSPFSQTGWSNYFDGVDDYIRAPSVSLGSGNFTLEAWQYILPQSTGFCRVYGIGDTFASTGISVTFTPSTSKFQVQYNNTTPITTSSTYNLYTWYHIAVVRSGSTITLYINGTPDGTATYSSAISGLVYISSLLYNGSVAYGQSYTSNFRLTNTAVYTGAFTPSTVPLTAISGTSVLTCQSNRFIDNSINGSTLFINGAPSVQAFSPFNPTAAYSAANVGGSGYFDGTGDYLRAPTGSSGAFGTGDFCLEAWYYPTSLSSSYYYVTNLESSGGGDAQWGLSGTTTTTRFNNWFAVPINATGAPTVNAWNHVVACRSGTTLSVFLNGTRIGTVTNSTNLSSTNDIRVGAYASGTDPIAGYLSGVRVVKGSSVYDPSASTLTVPTTPPTAISNTSFLLNYTNGGITDATAKNVLETGGGAAISTAQSKFGGSSMAFDGTGDYVFSPSSINYTLASDFTIEGWAYINASGNYRFFTIGDTVNTTGIEIYVSSGNYVVYSNGSVRITGSTATRQSWTHLAVVRSGSTVTLYINGSASGSTWSTSGTFSGTCYVGAEYYNGSLTSDTNGYIDDFRITKGYARYTTTFTPPTAAFPTQ